MHDECEHSISRRFRNGTCQSIRTWLRGRIRFTATAAWRFLSVAIKTTGSPFFIIGSKRSRDKFLPPELPSSGEKRAGWEANVPSYPTGHVAGTMLVLRPPCVRLMKPRVERPSVSDEVVARPVFGDDSRTLGFTFHGDNDVVRFDVATKVREWRVPKSDWAPRRRCRLL